MRRRGWRAAVTSLERRLAVELAHDASLVKDDIMYQDQERRSATSYWQRPWFDLGLLALNVILPHTILFTQVHGPGP